MVMMFLFWTALMLTELKLSTGKVRLDLALTAPLQTGVHKWVSVWIGNLLKFNLKEKGGCEPPFFYGWV